MDDGGAHLGMIGMPGRELRLAARLEAYDNLGTLALVRLYSRIQGCGKLVQTDVDVKKQK